jgi:dTDP-4-dehydrorhamnose reductase
MGFKRVYISGCGGMLGEAFHQAFSTTTELKCSDIFLNEEWLSFLDFRDYDSYRYDVSDFRPDLLVHLGAHTDLEYCERNKDDAYLTNYLSVENAVAISEFLSIPIVYISTAGIFDGTKEAYDDWDAPNPLGHYARSKYLGERYVTENSSRFLICRAGWMMGGGKKDKKFVSKIVKQILEGTRELFVVDDRLGTPTYTLDFARNVQEILNQTFWGTYNLACYGGTSRVEVAKKIVSVLGREHLVKVTPVSSNYFEKEYFAPRPVSEKLVSSRLKLRGLYRMRPWDVCLNEYLKQRFMSPSDNGMS